MDITPRIPGDILPVVIADKYTSWKVLVFIANERFGSTDPVSPYLSLSPLNHYNVYILPDVHPRVLGRCFNVCS